MQYKKLAQNIQKSITKHTFFLGMLLKQVSKKETAVFLF